MNLNRKKTGSAKWRSAPRSLVTLLMLLSALAAGGYTSKAGATASLQLAASVTPMATAVPVVQGLTIRVDSTARTMNLLWTPTTYPSFVAYEIAHNLDGGTPVRIVDKSVKSLTLSGSVAQFEEEQAYTVKMAIIGPVGRGPEVAAQVKLMRAPEVKISTVTTSSIAIRWTPVTATDPFAAYEIFVAPADYTGALSGCFHSSIVQRDTASVILTSPSSKCGGGTIQPGKAYRIGVRVIQQTANPGVWTGLAEATALTVGALPAQCRSTEKYCSVFPYGWVKTTAWPVAEQGQPVVMNGVNTKFGPQWLNGAWKVDDFTGPTGIAELIKANTRFNVVRINLDWGMFQHLQNGQVVLDEGAFAALDQMINVAATRNLNVILVPIHIRTIGLPADRAPNSVTLCKDPSSYLYQANFNIPRWAWDKVNTALPKTVASCDTFDQAFFPELPKVLKLAETKAYLRMLASRYSDFSNASRRLLSQTVVGIDLINEIRATGNMEEANGKVFDVYEALVKDLRANSTAKHKILIFEPVDGWQSPAKSIEKMKAIAQAGDGNVVYSFHDYFAGGGNGADLVKTDYGWGYNSAGWVDISSGNVTKTDVVGRPYTFSNEAAQHRQFVQQHMDWAAAAGIPLYIGEYGVFNTCGGNVEDEAVRYAADTRDLYDTLDVKVNGLSLRVPVSRTWWSHGIARDGTTKMELFRYYTGDCMAHPANTYYRHTFKLF